MSGTMYGLTQADKPEAGVTGTKEFFSSSQPMSLFGGAQNPDQRRKALASALMRSQPSPQSYSGSAQGSVLGGLGSGLTAALTANPEMLRGIWDWLSPQQKPMQQPQVDGTAPIPQVQQTPLPPIGG